MLHLSVHKHYLESPLHVNSLGLGETCLLRLEDLVNAK